MKKYLMLFMTMIAGVVSAEELTIQVKAPNGEPLQNIIVYAEVPSRLYPTLPPKDPIIINQQNKAFDPYISVVQKGHEVVFSNDDDFTHHIYSVTSVHQFSFKLRANKTNKVLFGAGEPVEKVSMGCNIHDWMTGHLLVLETPFFAVTDEEGKVSLSVPLNDYVVTAWHPQLQAKDNKLQQNITVTADSALEMTLSKPLLPIPEQLADDDFEYFGEKY